MKKRIVILGAGLSGLSAAWHLQKRGRACEIFEKEGQAGGLCRSKSINGFTFDYCGHLLHFKHRYTFGLIQGFLGSNLGVHKKSAWIYTHHKFTRYPFQVNLYGLPYPLIKECLMGFLRTLDNGKQQKKNPSFFDWIVHNLGAGIAKHFMIPYNTKFWTLHPKELTCEWLDGFIPLPSLKDILDGTIEENRRIFGYNATFWYPKRGGIQEVPRALASQIKGLSTGYEAGRLDIKNKIVHFKNGRSVKFDILLYTLPLPEITHLNRNLPQRISASLKALKYTSIFNLNLGLDRQKLSDKHWAYFPEKKFIFFRVGFPENFSPHSSPQKTSSLYIEVAYSETKPINKNTISRRIISDLVFAKIISPADKILTQDINDIKYGYIIYDRFKEKAVREIKTFLKKNDIFCLGRYGSWNYLSMEGALLEGKRIADCF